MTLQKYSKHILVDNKGWTETCVYACISACNALITPYFGIYGKL